MFSLRSRCRCVLCAVVAALRVLFGPNSVVDAVYMRVRARIAYERICFVMCVTETALEFDTLT